MHKPDPVETILARLMPVAMSDEGQRGIEAMLDELAGTEVAPMKKPWFRRPLTGGAAAAGIAAALVAWFSFPRQAAAPAIADTSGETEPGIILVGESGSISAVTEEGWQEDADGSAMRTLRFRVVEQDSLLDEETGIVMLVSEPRDEFLLMPVSTF